MFGLAEQEAGRLNHSYVGTEHLLLGLQREDDGLAAQVLGLLGFTVDAVRSDVLRIVGPGEEQVATGRVPFTPHAKKALELELRESLHLSHNYIGTEHILIGLARETQGVAGRILLGRDADANRIRDEVMRALTGGGAPTASSPASQKQPPVG